MVVTTKQRLFSCTTSTEWF